MAASNRFFDLADGGINLPLQLVPTLTPGLENLGTAGFVVRSLAVLPSLYDTFSVDLFSLDGEDNLLEYSCWRS